MFLHDINTIHYRYRVAAYIIQETKINLCSMFLYLQFPWNVGFGLGLQAYAVPYSSKEILTRRDVQNFAQSHLQKCTSKLLAGLKAVLRRFFFTQKLRS